MLTWLNHLYDDPTYLIVAALCFVLFICIIKKPARREEEASTEAPITPALPLKGHVAFIGSIPSLPPLALPPPAPTVVETLPLPELKRYVDLVEALLLVFDTASVTVPGAYVDPLLCTFADIGNVSYSKPDEQGKVRMRFLPPGQYPDAFLVA